MNRFKLFLFYFFLLSFFIFLIAGQGEIVKAENDAGCNLCETRRQVCDDQSQEGYDQCAREGQSEEECVDMMQRALKYCTDQWSACRAACQESKGLFGTPSKGFQGIIQRVENIGKGPGFTGTKPLEQTIGGIIKAALLLVGTIFLMLMVYGGYIWMTARGEEEEAKRAQNIITMAIIGIMVVLAAYAITYFIVYRLTMATGAGLQ